MAQSFKQLNNKIVQYLSSFAVRQFMSELGQGLVLFWFIGFALEIWRPGLVSLYMDLNFVLLLGLLAYIVGKDNNETNRLINCIKIVLILVLLFFIFNKYF